MGLLGFRFTAAYEELSDTQRLIITIGFIVFTLRNHLDLRENRIRFNSVLLALQEYQFREEQGVNLSHVFSKYKLISPYITVSVQVIVACIIVYIL
jgi:hypothetical protein